MTADLHMKGSDYNIALFTFFIPVSAPIIGSRHYDE